MFYLSCAIISAHTKHICAYKHLCRRTYVYVPTKRDLCLQTPTCVLTNRHVCAYKHPLVCLQTDTCVLTNTHECAYKHPRVCLQRHTRVLTNTHVCAYKHPRVCLQTPTSVLTKTHVYKSTRPYKRMSLKKHTSNTPMQPAFFPSLSIIFSW